MKPRSALIVAVDPRMRPELLDEAISDVVRSDDGTLGSLKVLIPLVLPSTLPITACPPRIAARLERLHEAASEAMERTGVTGRVEIEPCRGVPALLRLVPRPDTLVLVGRAGWSVRRAARGVADDIVIFPAAAGRDAQRHHRVPRLRPAE
jgi:hypothetical protein